MIYKYLGDGEGFPHIPAKDLTKADLKRMKELYGVGEKEIKKTGLYKKIKTKKSEVKDE